MSFKLLKKKNDKNGSFIILETVICVLPKHRKRAGFFMSKMNL